MFGGSASSFPHQRDSTSYRIMSASGLTSGQKSSTGKLEGFLTFLQYSYNRAVEILPRFFLAHRQCLVGCLFDVADAGPASSSRTTGLRPSSRRPAGTTGTSSPPSTSGRGASKVSSKPTSHGACSSNSLYYSFSFCLIYLAHIFIQS